MNIKQLTIPDVMVIQAKVFGDERGFFFESYNAREFNRIINENYPQNEKQEIVFVQDNHSKSSQGVLRGLHYQVNQAQAKLVRVISGEIFDVAVDLRKSSDTFGQWVGEKLSAENKKQMWIPQGFAHGFVVLSDTAEVLYKTTNYYSPADERCIIWNDQQLNINWGIKNPVLSEKDKNGQKFSQAEVFV